MADSSDVTKITPDDDDLLCSPVDAALANDDESRTTSLKTRFDEGSIDVVDDEDEDDEEDEEDDDDDDVVASDGVAGGDDDEERGALIFFACFRLVAAGLEVKVEVEPVDDERAALVTGLDLRSF